MLDLDRLMSMAMIEDVAGDLKAEIAQDLARGSPRPEWAEAVDTVMANVAPSLDRNSLDGRVFARTLLRGFATLIDERVALVRGDTIAIPPAAELPSPEPFTTAPEPAFLSLWDTFAADKVANGNWTASSAYNARSSRRLFAGLVPDGDSLAIKDVNAGVTQALHRNLLRLPAAYDKSYGRKLVTA